jgi:dolichol-phosphate mannosyltransferase
MVPSISIIMPALNEESALSSAVMDVLSTFDKMNVEGEVVVVNDGSTDRTGEIADALRASYPRVRVLHHAKPKGIGGAFWAGAQMAKNEVVTMLPGDGENESYEILRYLPMTEHVDIVVPFVYNREIRTASRRMVSKLYKGIINLSFGLLLNYMNGTVLYRRKVLLSLNLESHGFFYQTELLIKSILRGYLYAEVPYALKERVQGDSKALRWKSFLNLSHDYLRAFKAVHFGKGNTNEIIPQSVTAHRRAKLSLSSKPAPYVGAMNLEPEAIV